MDKNKVVNSSCQGDIVAEWKVASDIDKRITNLRFALGSDDKPITKVALAKRAMVRPQQIGMWEKNAEGTQKPTKTRLENWAAREGWPIEIFQEDGPMPSDVVNRIVNEQIGDGRTPEPTPEAMRPYLARALEIIGQGYLEAARCLEATPLPSAEERVAAVVQELLHEWDRRKQAPDEQ